MYQIRVPATSANLGPGFDCLGLALNLYNEFLVEPATETTLLGVEEAYNDSDNLFLVAYRSTFDNEPLPIQVTFQTNIPISRGLGSSSSLIIGGILAGYLIQEKALEVDAILEKATAIEGHPDNVSPALLGGLVASYQTIYRKLPVDYSYHFTLLIPNVKVSTEEARAILPDQYSRSVAVSNSAKAILMVDALQHFNLHQLRTAATDEIHEPYRKTLIPHFDEVKKILTKNNQGVFLMLLVFISVHPLYLMKKERPFKKWLIGISKKYLFVKVVLASKRRAYGFPLFKS